jgi:hypothetical protein
MQLTCRRHFLLWAIALIGVFVALYSVRFAFAAGEKKAVAVFDFVSKYDEGRLGQNVGEMFPPKIKRLNVFDVNEMVDVRDLCTENNVKITLDTPLPKVKQAVCEMCGAQIGIWGQVELAPGAENEIYDITLKCVDFSGGEPKVIYEKTARTNSAAEIPHLYVKELIDKLHGREPGAPPPENPVAEENWKNGPNLIVGGDFEKGSGGIPKGWESRCGQDRQPLGHLVVWGPEIGNPKNKVIRFDIDRGIAEGTGAMYYSDYFPVTEGATYRFQLRYRSAGPVPKIFIKCYDDIPTEYTQGYEPPPDSPSHKTSAGGKKGKEVLQRREVYRSQQNLEGGGKKWITHTQDFTPKHTKYSPKWGKIDLYVYLTPGVAEFDDVVVKEIIPSTTDVSKKVQRHSLDTKVTIEEMKANEARGDEARKRIKESDKKSPSKKKPAADEE